MANIRTMTLADLAECGDLNPEYARIAKRILVDSYDDFIDTFYDDIDQCVIEIERNRELRQESGEDLISVDIVSMLKVIGYNATHDAKTGGHVDLTVHHAKGYEWLGEAKIHSTYDYLYEGFLQLCTRYSTGSPTSSCGGILAYIKTHDASSVMANWRATLHEKGLPSYEDWDCEKRMGLSFFSRHTHDVSGMPYTVRHMAIMLSHSPRDRSARSSKKGKISK